MIYVFLPFVSKQSKREWYACVYDVSLDRAKIVAYHPKPFRTKLGATLSSRSIVRKLRRWST